MEDGRHFACATELCHLHTQATLSAAEKADSVVVVDCYATWCPPCKACAPIYAKMSENFSSCVFAKVNVDEAKDVAGTLGIRSMCAAGALN